MSFWFISTASDETGKSKSPPHLPLRPPRVSRGDREQQPRVEEVCSILCDNFRRLMITRSVTIFVYVLVAGIGGSRAPPAPHGGRGVGSSMLLTASIRLLSRAECYPFVL